MLTLAEESCSCCMQQWDREVWQEGVACLHKVDPIPQRWIPELRKSVRWEHDCGCTQRESSQPALCKGGLGAGETCSMNAAACKEISCTQNIVTIWCHARPACFKRSAWAKSICSPILPVNAPCSLTAPAAIMDQTCGGLEVCCCEVGQLRTDWAHIQRLCHKHIQDRGHIAAGHTSAGHAVLEAPSHLSHDLRHQVELQQTQFCITTGTETQGSRGHNCRA